jgi:CRP/FNR family transcriptional regulator, cyclic AMP receptor protein
MLAPANTVEIFSREKDCQVITAGQVIFRAGEVGTHMYGILTGEVDLLVGDRIVETLHAGDAFGEGALVQPQMTRATTAIARTDCRLAALDKRRFLFAIQETPNFALEVVHSLSNRLRQLKQQAAIN